MLRHSCGEKQVENLRDDGVALVVIVIQALLKIDAQQHCDIEELGSFTVLRFLGKPLSGFIISMELGGGRGSLSIKYLLTQL